MWRLSKNSLHLPALPYPKVSAVRTGKSINWAFEFSKHILTKQIKINYEMWVKILKVQIFFAVKLHIVCMSYIGVCKIYVCIVKFYPICYV